MAGSKPADASACTDQAAGDRVGVVRLFMARPQQAATPADATPAPERKSPVAPSAADTPRHAGTARPASSLPVWPFLLADGLLVTSALTLVTLTPHPLNPWVCLLAVALVLGGAVMALLPWMMKSHAHGPSSREPQRRFQNRLPIKPA